MESLWTKAKSYIPSRNWLIFLGTTGTLASTLAYDKYKLSEIRKSLEAEASLIANEPLPFFELPRRVIVFISPGDFPRYWFNEYVKPVFDAAGLDYELHDVRKGGQTRKIVRDHIWDGKEELTKKLLEDQAKRTRQLASRGSWFRPRDEDVDLGLIGNVLRDLERRPKYDSTEGLIAVGPEAWTEVLQGLNDGCVAPRVPSLTDAEARLKLPPEPVLPKAGENPSKQLKKEIEKAEEERQKWYDEKNALVERHALYPPISREDTGAFLPWFQPPPLGYLPGRNLIGWGNFPHRIYTWFTSHKLMQEVGSQALLVARGNKRPFDVTKDTKLGESDACSLADPEKGTEWEDKKAWIGPRAEVADRIEIYA
ncbi:mitochondrial import inner membrane translocase subunit tim54 [Phlyctochytrium planicorne]|nr:mitochondrial import inner membrane translocase subunit tim54 [Phlyctochytrium planicorne]